MTDFENNEPDRPEFQGKMIISYVNGQHMLYFPAKEFAERLFSSQAVIISFMLLVMGVVTSIYVLRFSIQKETGTFASTIASVLNTIQITVFNFIYQRIAIYLTNMENHRTDTQYEDSLIVKLFAFQFINSYASFFFLAFIAQNLEPAAGTADDFTGQCGYKNCMQPLSINLAIIFGTRLFVKNIMDIVLPLHAKNEKRKAESKTTDGEIGRAHV
jgi:hypothetical protein